MNTYAKFAAACVGSLLAVDAMATPEVTSCEMTQSPSTRKVTITYTLQNYPAVVTLDIVTNNTGTGQWVSIGGEHICNATGDVWCKVDKANGTIKWDPDLSWPDHVTAVNGAKAVVTAWAMDNTPDYMVVDLTAGSSPDSQKYFVSTNFLAGGLLANDIYKRSKMVMRKIMAKDVEWTMGSTTAETVGRSTNEVTHLVTLPHNYYIGVFEVTQAQWETVKGSWAGTFANATYRAGRPVETLTFAAIRNSSPAADPDANSFLGIARSRTGLDFDLPSEAQWEFACRAGHGDMKWGNGTTMNNQSQDNDPGLKAMARFYFTNSRPDDSDVQNCYCTDAKATAKVGSYQPNSWGIYDMHGNVSELCLDWYEDNITSYGGAVNVSPSNPANTISGNAGSNRVLRGGSWGWGCSYGSRRPANRTSWNGKVNWERGFRVVCGAGLK